MSKMVRMTIDLDNPPPLTADQIAQLDRLAAMSDDDIDFSDIPLTDFSNAFRFRDRHLHPEYYKPVKRSTTVRIDADVLQWLRDKGAGYQTRLNAILREAMLRETG